jgi:catechol 2,3-dioxygenase-like lactoylglutathione lyase family enzyme
VPTDPAAPPWAIRSTLVAVSDLDRSVDFYREIGPFEELLRDDAVAVLGDPSPASVMLILRETRSNRQARHGPQSLGLRTMTFNVGSVAELDRIESVLHRRDLFTSRRSMADGASDLLNGRDPDNLPVVFVCYREGATIGPDYYRTVIDLFYTLDT